VIGNLQKLLGFFGGRFANAGHVLCYLHRLDYDFGSKRDGTRQTNRKVLVVVNRFVVFSEGPIEVDPEIRARG